MLFDRYDNSFYGAHLIRIFRVEEIGQHKGCCFCPVDIVNDEVGAIFDGI